MVGMDGGLFGGAGGPSAGQAAAVAVRPAVEGAILIDGADRRVVAMPSPAEFYALWSVTNNDRLVPN